MGVVKHLSSYAKKMASRAVYVVAAKRTPFGTFGGKLKGVTATDLCQVAASAALDAGKIPVEAVDSVVVGNVAQVKSMWAWLTFHMSISCTCSISGRCFLLLCLSLL